MPKFTVRYGIDDGFVTGRRENTFEIDSEELWDMDVNEFEDLYYDAMHDHFMEYVHPTPINLKEFLEWAEQQHFQQVAADEGEV